jgi:hypothetical protein
VEQRISIITLGVADLDHSRQFYERLGWRRSMPDSKGVVFFQAGGMIFSLYPRTDLATDAQIPPAREGFAAFSIAYNARTRGEVDSVLAQALATGAKLLRPAQVAFWGGYSGYFADPDGFVWEVAWNPSFTIDEDGSIHLPD